MPRRKAKLDLTLFPFLSVLSGLIALMVLLMIVTVSTRVVSSTPAPAAPPKPPAGGDQKPTARPVEDGIDADRYRRLAAQIETTERTLAGRREEQRKVREQLRELSALVHQVRAERTVVAASTQQGVRLGDKTRMKMIPAGGFAGGKVPVFIEVELAGYLVYPGKTRYPATPKPGKPDEVVVPADLERVIVGIARDGKTYPLLLVRPEGATAFKALLEVIDRLREKHKDLGVGWEPFSPEWVLDNK